MNILMLNPVHPDTPHISAVRAWYFACELAALGHRVVLLTGVGKSGETLNTVDASHDWRRPLVVPCAPARWAAEEYGMRLPTSVRRARTALRMLRHGGAAVGWVQAAVATGIRIAPIVKPDVIWTTFGKLEAVFAAKRIALALRCPWVLDVKDNWELYVPHGLRRLIAWRVRGAAAASANSVLTCRLTVRWQGVDPTLVYSGVDDCFFAHQEQPVAPCCDINLVGGVYFPDRLRKFLNGVMTWYRRLPQESQRQVRFRYFGSDTQLVRAAVGELAPNLPLELPGYVTAETMAKLCQQACVNAYIRHEDTFHHKLLELLACGRPVLAFPAESEEALALAAPTGHQLVVPETPLQMADTLTRLTAPFFQGAAPAAYDASASVGRFSWSNQTLLLQQMLRTVTSAG